MPDSHDLEARKNLRRFLGAPEDAMPNPALLQKPEPTQLDRIEQKLDTLIAALAEDLGQDEEEDPNFTLDGVQKGGERDQTQSLG